MMSKVMIVEEFGKTFLKVWYDGEGFASKSIQLDNPTKDLELIINAIGAYKEKNKGPGRAGRVPLSAEFINAIVCGEEEEFITCGVCKRLHYVLGAQDNHKDDIIFFDPYLERAWKIILEGAKHDQNAFIVWDKPIPWGKFCGHEVVIGCPCNEKYFEPYENFLWLERNIILEYFIKKTQAFITEKTIDVFQSEFDNMIDDKDLESLKKLMSKIPSGETGYKRVVTRRNGQ
jgi:hypothetical protein